MSAERSFDGTGQQEGPLRADWGPGFADLRCDQCNATWVGRIGEPCTWCANAHRSLLEQHVRILLTPPAVDPDDITRPARVITWAQRMAQAVKAGIITRQQAEAAYRREVGRSAA